MTFRYDRRIINAHAQDYKTTMVRCSGANLFWDIRRVVSPITDDCLGTVSYPQNLGPDPITYTDDVPELVKDDFVELNFKSGPSGVFQFVYKVVDTTRWYAKNAHASSGITCGYKTSNVPETFFERSKFGIILKHHWPLITICRILIITNVKRVTYFMRQ